MKHFLLSAAIAFLSMNSFAGISYRFESVSGGFGASTLSGVVEAEGDRMRVNIERGDGAVFRDGSYVIAGAGVVSIVDPSARTYSQISLGDLGGAAMIFDQLRSMMDLRVKNPRVSARDRGTGPVLAGYATRHWTVESSADLVVGTDTAIGLAMKNESWTTDKLPAKYANLLDSRELRTGVAELDRLLDAESSKLTGFPLKRVSSISIRQGGSPMTMTTTTTVSGIETRAFVPAEFALPTGYAKVDNPIERAMKVLKP